MEGEAPVGGVASRCLLDERERALLLHENGEAGFGPFALNFGQQRDDAFGGRGAAVAIVFIADVIDNETVEAGFMVGQRQQRTEAGEKAGFELRAERHVPPGFDRVLAGIFGFALGEIGGGECCKSGAVVGTAFGEGCANFRGVAAADEEGFLIALGEETTLGPGGVCIEEGAVVGGRAKAAAQAVPCRQFGSDGICNARAVLVAFFGLAGAICLYGIAQGGGVFV